jgi:hypothetical protein
MPALIDMILFTLFLMYIFQIIAVIIGTFDGEIKTKTSFLFGLTPLWIIYLIVRVYKTLK